MNTSILRTLEGHFLVVVPTGGRPIESVGPDGEDLQGVEYDLDDFSERRVYRLVVWDTHATCDCPQYRALDDCRHVAAAAINGFGAFADAYSHADPRLSPAEGGAL